MTRPAEQRLLTEANAGTAAKDPSTPLGAALQATYLAAVDETGAAIPGKRGSIVFNANGEPLNITLEDI